MRFPRATRPLAAARLKIKPGRKRTTRNLGCSRLTASKQALDLGLMADKNQSRCPGSANSRRPHDPSDQEDAPTEEAYTSERTPARTTACSKGTRRLPSTFTRRVIASSRPGWISHAKWMTASAPRKIGSRSLSATSAWTKRARPSACAPPGAASERVGWAPHRRLGGERAQHRGADVPGRARDDNSHRPRTTPRGTSLTRRTTGARGQGVCREQATTGLCLISALRAVQRKRGQQARQRCSAGGGCTPIA